MSEKPVQVLSGTSQLTFEGDLAAQMVEDLDNYTSRAIKIAAEKRETLWHRDYSSHTAYIESVEPNRQRLIKQIGCQDERLPIDALSYVGTTMIPERIAEGQNFSISRVRWQVFDEVDGEGLLIEPNGDTPVVAQVIALPDCRLDTRNVSVVVSIELPSSATVCRRRLAAPGCRVVFRFS